MNEIKKIIGFATGTLMLLVSCGVNPSTKNNSSHYSNNKEENKIINSLNSCDNAFNKGENIRSNISFNYLKDCDETYEKGRKYRNQKQLQKKAVNERIGRINKSLIKFENELAAYRCVNKLIKEFSKINRKKKFTVNELIKLVEKDIKRRKNNLDEVNKRLSNYKYKLKVQKNIKKKSLNYETYVVELKNTLGEFRKAQKVNEQKIEDLNKYVKKAKKVSKHIEKCIEEKNYASSCLKWLKTKLPRKNCEISNFIINKEIKITNKKITNSLTKIRTLKK